MPSNSWHKTMYDEFFASETIGSKEWSKRSDFEAEFLIEKLELPSAAKILDLPCGTGRHSLRFARHGYAVTGVDISRACIKLAKQNSSHKNVQYKIGDMANLSQYKGKFDAVTNLFSSFGYFKTDLENFKVLQGMVKCLKPNGKLVINTINRDFVLSSYQPAIFRTNGNVTMVQASIYDANTRYNEAYICVVNDKTGRGTARYHRIRFYSPSELKKIMQACGLKVSIFGDFLGTKFDPKKSTHPIYLGTKS